MTKLHEILAVDKDKERQAKIIHDETVKMWKKPNYFSATHKNLEMFDENRTKEAEAFEEKTAMTTTVPARLTYTAQFLIDHIDVLMQKESTNQYANANIEINIDADTVLPIAANVPATMLLGLERELGRYRSMFLETPTLDSGVEWIEDADIGEYVFKAVNPVKVHKTEKTMKVVSLAIATNQHKEQVATMNQDTIVGQYTTKKWSGMITSARKAELLTRFDTLLAAIKQARMRANEQEVTSEKIGAKLFNYIFGV